MLIGQHLLELLAIEIVRVRVERSQHSGNRRLNEIVVIDLVAVDVMLLNHRESFAEILADGRRGRGRGRNPRAPRSRSSRPVDFAGRGSGRTVGVAPWLRDAKARKT